MRKIALALVLTTALSGCAGISQRLLGFDIQASVQNPVTQEMLYSIESGLSAATAGLLTYRRLCLAGKADTHCQGNIRQIQVYTRQAKPLILSLRAFVKENDQVNAISAFNELRNLVEQIKATRATMGVQ